MNRRTIIIIITVIVAGLGTAGYAVFKLWPDIRNFAQQAGFNHIATGAATTIAVVGDNHGATEIYQQILNDVAADKPALMINLADTSEYGERDEFTAVKKMEARQTYPVIHVVGSHDIKADPSRQAFIDVFGHEPCSAVDVGSVRIIMLDNADRKVGFSETCLEWFDRELAASSDKTVLVAYHRPFDLPLGDILGDDETAVSRASNVRFKNILKKYNNVAEILTAHLHTYLAYSVAGIPAVVSGGGGDPAQIVLGGPSANYFHYLILTIRGRAVEIAVHRVQLRD